MLSYDYFFNLIRQYKKNVKNSSIKAYSNNLVKLQKQDFELDNEDSIIDFFENIDEKFKKDNDKPITYYFKKNNLSALSVYLQALGKSTLKIKNMILTLKEEFEVINNENTKSEKDKKNWVSRKELIKIYNDKLKILKSLDIHKKKKKTLDKTEKRILQEYLIMSLYLLIPPRRLVYSNTKFITNDDFNKKTLEDKESNNYLVYTNRNVMFFSLGDWKNSNRVGRVVLDIPLKLRKVINLWYKFNKDRNNDWFLTNQYGKKLSSNNLTKYLNDAFSASGKKISSTLLRKIYISENKNVRKYFNSKKKVEELAFRMGHGVNVQQTTYFKKDN